MAKIVVFQGSPRKNGWCARLTEQVIAGIQSQGGEVLVCDLNEVGIKGCQGCNYCKTHTECITKDKMSPALEALRTADGVVATFPIYWGGISGQSKLFIDRLYSFTAKGFSSKHPGKKAVTIFAQGAGSESAYQHVVDTYNGSFKMLGWELTDSILAFGTNTPGAEMTQALLDRAYEAGKNLAK